MHKITHEGDKVTASTECKDLGFTLKEASRRLGQKKCGNPTVSTQTLNNWFKNKPELFSAVIHGLAYLE